MRSDASARRDDKSMDTPRAPKPSCDPAAAIERLGSDVELYKDLLYTLFQGASGQLTALRSAVAAGDSAAMHRSAHALKGLASTCGADAVAESAQELEDLGRADELLGATEAMAELEHRLDNAQDVLASYLDRGAPAR